MAGRLTETYGLTLTEVAEVLGSSAEYKVSEVADRNAGVVLKTNKDRLQSLPLPSKVVQVSARQQPNATFGGSFSPGYAAGHEKREFREESRVRNPRRLPSADRNHVGLLDTSPGPVW